MVGKNCEECHADISPAEDGHELRGVPHGAGLEYCGTAGKDHQNRFPLFRRARRVQCEDCHKGAAVGQFQVCRRLRFLSLAGFSEDHQSESRQCQFATPATRATRLTIGWARSSITAQRDSCDQRARQRALRFLPHQYNYNLTTARTTAEFGLHLDDLQQTNNPVHSTAVCQFGGGELLDVQYTISWTTAISITARRASC